MTRRGAIKAVLHVSSLAVAAPFPSCGAIGRAAEFNEVRFGAGETSRSVTLAVGGTLIVYLPSGQPRFAWRVDAATLGGVLVEDQRTTFTYPGAIPASGYTTFGFRAVRSGKVKVLFRFYNAGQKEALEEATLDVTVE